MSNCLLRTVVLPVAGQGTRLLPSTKATPKELLPVYDQPVLQFGIDEALAAGAERIVIVTHPTKDAIREYLKPTPRYIDTLQRKGKNDLARKLENILVPDSVEIVFAQQEEQLGLGHAVLCAMGDVLDGPFGVILPDDVILGSPCLQEMAESYRGGHMVAAMEVEPADVSRYGILVPRGGDTTSRCIDVIDMVEKPSPSTAPSRLAAVGRYVLGPTIFESLEALEPGAGGEYQLTDAIASDSRQVGLTGFRFSGRRYDCGTHDGLLDAGLARRRILQRARAEQEELRTPPANGGYSLGNPLYAAPRTISY